MHTKLVASEKDRVWLLDALGRGLAPGEVLVKAWDTYRASGRMTLHLPVDPGASVAAQERPLLQPGGITEMITYYRVRDPTFREITFAGPVVERDVDIHHPPVRISRFGP